MSEDEKLRRLAELREKAIMDEKSIRRAGYKRGMEAGLKDRNGETVKKNGIELGEKSGRLKEKINIAQKLKKLGMSVEEIMEVTKLSKEEIEKLN